MEVTLRFTLPEEQAELTCAQKGTDYHLAMVDMANLIFRPARKHGYTDQKIQALIDKIGDDAYELVGLLEDKFYWIVQEFGLKL